MLALRATWVKVHLVLALVAGFFFAILGLTGSACLYLAELDSLFNPHLTVAASQAKRQSLDAIFSAVKRIHPNRYGSWTLEMPLTSDGMITAWFDKPQETYFDFHAPLMVSVNPYTAEVVANRFWGKTFATWLADLHTQLQLGELGWDIVGLVGIGLLFSLGSGLYLWWPGWAKLLANFAIRVNAGQQALLLDVHRNIGFLSAIALLVLTVTGINLSYPQMLQAIAGSAGMAHGETGRNIVSTANPTQNPTTLDDAVFVARALFPKAELRRISTPLGETGVYRINFRQSGEVNHRHPYTTVWIDHWSGQIKAVRDPMKFSQGEVVGAWVWPLHTGEAIGGLGRFLWFLSGLCLFGLYVSGVVVWLFRRGTLRNKAVDLSRFKTSMYRILQSCVSLGGKIQRYMAKQSPRLINALLRCSGFIIENTQQYIKALKLQKTLLQWLKRFDK